MFVVLFSYNPPPPPEKPILFAVDQINTWSVPSSFQYEKVPIMPNDICVPHSLNFISKKKAEVEKFKLKNGLCVGTVSLKHPGGSKLNFYDSKNSIPLLIKVPEYSQVEFLSAFQYYTEHGRISSNHTTQDFLLLRTFCSSNPRLLRLESSAFLTPINEDSNFDENMVEDVPYDAVNTVKETEEFSYENNNPIFDTVLTTKSSANADE